MTNDEMKEMLERQLVRLEEMSKKTTSSKALSGLTNSMLAVSHRLKRSQICYEIMGQAEEFLQQACESMKEISEAIRSQCGEEDPLCKTAEEASLRLGMTSLCFRAAIDAMNEERKESVNL